MRTDIIRMYKDVHSWVGIFSGLALFIAFYAGAITMFEKPLQRWSSPAPVLGQAVPLSDADTLIARTLAARPEAVKSYSIHVDVQPESPARMSWTTGPRGDPGPTYYATLDESGAVAVTAQGPSPVAEFVDVLHQQVGLPLSHEPAMIIMGLVCLLYAIALVSGTIVLIPSLIKDMFLIRAGKNVKRMWLDVHNALGLFSLPFHLVMVFSALIFAFHDQFYQAQELAFKTAKETPAEHHHTAAPSARLLSPADVVAKMSDQAPEFRPQTLNYALEPEGLYVLRVQGTDPGHGLRGPDFGVAEVNPYTGSITGSDYMPGKQSGWFATLTSFFSLHFGNFGGSTVRWMYFILGLSGAFLFYSGNLLWVESRRKKERKAGAVTQTRATRILGSLTVGVTLGCICGISLTLAAAKWAGPSATPALHSAIYYTAFCLAVAWALWRGVARSAANLLWCAVLSTLAIPASSVAAPMLGDGWNHGGVTLLVDITACMGALVLGVAAVKTSRRTRHGSKDSIWSGSSARSEAVRSPDPEAIK